MAWLTDTVLADALAHARQEEPREACGLIVLAQRRARYWPCCNLAEGASGEDFFHLAPADYAAAEDAGTVLAIVHSHPHSGPSPTLADRAGIEATRLPWLIVQPALGTHTLTEPSGYVAPLLGRPFVHGVFDCGSLVRDYFNRAFGLDIQDHPREDYWWLEPGADLYRQTLPLEGFVRVDEAAPYDVVLVQGFANTDVLSHAGVLLPGGLVLHHARDRLSCRDVYNRWWRQAAREFWRHPAVASKVPRFEV